MSVSPKSSSIDLEKGHPASLSPAFALPQRRRKLIFALLLIFSVLFFVYATESSESSLSSSSWRWVKDSMKPVSSTAMDASSVLDVDKDLDGTIPPFEQDTPDDQPLEQNATLASSATKSDISTPSDKLVEAQPPSHVDQMLLFLSAMKNRAYRVPELQVHRLQELQPSSKTAFAEALAKVQADEGKDGSLYLESQSSWRQKHLAESPLTVFSKSYCPYSKRAKTLLTQIGAHFDVYEVDLREDARSLQAGLKELSQHATFPTILVGDKLIGGYDDLSRLQQTGVLLDILKGAGVKFN